MARIDKYAFGATVGSVTKTLMEADREAYLKGELNEEAIALIKQNLIIQQLAITAVSEDAFLGEKLDATLKYP